MIKKILISIAAIISILLFSHLIIYNYNSYKLSSDNQTQADYSEAQSRIQEFKNSIKLPPENISKEENGHYWYSEAFKTIGKEKANRQRQLISNFIKNPEKASFQDKEIVEYLNLFKDAFKSIKKGNSCKYFDFTALSYPIGSIPHFVELSDVATAYSIKACCYINNKQYEMAYETLHECFTFIRCFSKNAAMGDRKTAMSFIVEFASIRLNEGALNYLLKKSDKPYPMLLSDIKLLLSDMSFAEFKKSLDFELTMMLFYVDQQEEGKDVSTVVKDLNAEKDYKMLGNDTIERQYNVYMAPFAKLYNTLYYKKLKSSLMSKYRNILKHTDKFDSVELEMLKEEATKEHISTNEYFLFQEMPDLLPSFKKINYRRAEVAEALKKVENQLEERGN